MSWDFRPPFLNDSNPCGDLINRLKYFRIWFRFPQYIWSKSSKNSIPHAVCMILRSQNFRLSENNFFPFKFDAHRRAQLHSVYHTVESDYFNNTNFSCFVICYVFWLRLKKNSWSKKDSMNNSWLTVLIIIFRHHR